MTKEAVLIYPHQLFAEHPALAPGRTAYLLEDPLYFSQYKFHKQKLVLHRASMKAYEAYLLANGHTVRYIDHAALLTNSLEKILADDGVRIVHVADVVDNWLQKKIERAIDVSSIDLQWYETPQFLTTDAEVRAYWGSKKKHLQHNFYTWQRTRLDVLVQDGKPAGGRWSFDTENRKPLPKQLAVPDPFMISQSVFVTEAIAYVDENFSDHYGAGASFSYAVTHEEARSCLQAFLSERLATFGDYEDAIALRSHAVFHSLLSPYLNNGLLTPQEVLDAVLAHADTHEVPLASLEGFVRQLIGWREFIRMAYVCDGTRMRKQNVLGAVRSLPESWWNGTTDMLPIDETIRTLDAHAYTHHIIRLMVVGNLMTLLGIDPDEAYRWFMEWYVDAYDWVMVPNVYGMALFADGGTMTTKPYVSSSRYLLKMSDYPKGEWTAAWDALYWAFVDKHQALLSANQRAGFSVIMFNRFDKDKQEGYREHARKIIDRLTS